MVLVGRAGVDRLWAGVRDQLLGGLERDEPHDIAHVRGARGGVHGYQVLRGRRRRVP